MKQNMLEQRPDLLITGATGNVGFETLRALNAAGVMPLGAVRDPQKARAILEGKAILVRFDFLDSSTYTGALTGVKGMLLVRPPEIAQVDRYFRPLLEEARAAGVQQVVFLSLLGAANNTVVPHHKIEKLLLELNIPHVFLRAGFFMQNLSTTHQADIRDRDDVFVPAGHGKTSVIDARDIGEVASLALLERHQNVEYDLTGDEALTYGEVAQILSEELDRPIRYSQPNIFKFALERRKHGDSWPFIGVMLGIYLVAALGKAAQVTDTTRALLGRPATTLREFVGRNKALWTPISSKTQKGDLE